MKIRSLFTKICLLLLCLSIVPALALAQRAGSKEPRQEKLLNGLKVLLWNDPGASDVKVSIRVHSGSAFDPQGKEGVMRLLADNIFPTAASRDFFAEDLEGGVEVISNYDYIQINANSKPSEFITLLETLAQAISNPTIDKETTAALKASLGGRLATLEKDPVYVADRAAAKRLFGGFPYGRPQLGTLESLERIDFADLQFARDRFLSADNATVAISGNFNGDVAFRAARRFLGAWLKSDKRVPSTFRQPDDPDTKPLELAASDGMARSTFALRGVARNDPDFAASRVLEYVLRSRLERRPGNFAVSSEARTLPGVIVIKGGAPSVFPSGLLADKLTDAEFAAARAAASAEFAKRTLIDQWLDTDTYRTNVTAETQAFQNVTAAGVQRLADRLAKNPVVSVVIKPVSAAQ